MLTGLFAMLPSPALANSWDSCVKKLPAGGEVPTLRCFPVVFSNLTSTALTFVGAVAVILIVYSGIKFVTSGGDPKKVGEARAIMTYAIIGAVIVLLSFTIIYLISYFTGADCVTDFSIGSCN